MTVDVYVAGSRGLLGTALMAALTAAGRRPLESWCDLRDQSLVRAFFREHRPRTVYLAAARVGGIAANIARPWDFIADNLEIQTAVMAAALSHGCRRLIFFGSSCIYPTRAPRPLEPSSLMTGPLEPTNAAYAMAKLAGIEAVLAARRQKGLVASVIIPCNLYGRNDRYGVDGHVIPMLIARMHEAKMGAVPTFAVWGSGHPRREFLHADDVARAALLVEEHPEIEVINVGVGGERRGDVTIADLARAVAMTVGYTGELVFDETQPDGVSGKLLDCTAIEALGFWPRIPLMDGLRDAYDDFLQASAAGRLRR